MTDPADLADPPVRDAEDDAADENADAWGDAGEPG